MRRPRLLDLFCGAGGCSVGYHRAGFDVVGVDIRLQPNYPFEFVQADALDMCVDYVALHFDAIHASPPCQHFTKYGNVVKDIKERYEDLLAPTRELLISAGRPYVIENVEGAPMAPDAITLCGSMFDMDIRRHRLFEANWPIAEHHWPCRHKIWAPNRYRGGSWKRMNAKDPSIRPSHPIRMSMEIGTWGIPLDKQKQAMGVDWPMTVRELSESIPPVYTEFIGHQLMNVVTKATA